MTIYHDQVGLIPKGYRTSSTQNHMIISLDAEKAFDKIQYPFRIKVLESLGIQGTYLNIIEVICSKPTANVNLNGEKLKTFLVKSGTRQGCPLYVPIQYVQ